MKRLASYGAGTVTKAHATQQTNVTSNNPMSATNLFNQFSLSPLRANETLLIN